MLNRQRAILEFLLLADRKISRVELVKWLFLARQETTISDEIPFYDFVPYRYGPFSFTLYKDLDDLADSKLVDRHSLSITRSAGKRVIEEVKKLNQNVRQSISSIYSTYCGLTGKKLLDVVYSEYPWYASRSVLTEHSARDRSEVAIYTASYEGKSIEAFINQLLHRGIERIIDVRANPFSHKFGFSKQPLASLCKKNRISYTHFPELGIPAALRRDLSDSVSYESLFREYNSRILPGATESIARVRQMVSVSPSALLCFEAQPSMCHRSHLAAKLESISGLRVQNL